MKQSRHNNSRRITYVALPRGARRLRPWLWLMWSLVVLGAGGYGVVAFLQEHPITSYRSYTGELRPLQAPSILSLPPGAFVDQVLVARNDKVRRGQTLVTLDTTAMTDRLHQLEETLQQDRILQRCLLADAGAFVPQKDPVTLQEEVERTAPASGQAKPEHDRQTGGNDGVPPDRSIHLTMTLQTCASHHTKATAVQTGLQQQLSVLEEEKALIDQYIRLLTTPVPDSQPSDTDGKTARQALALALTRNQLEAQKVALKHKAQAALADLQEERIRQVQELEQRLQTADHMRRQLETYLAQPRLLAPDSGQVVRVRGFSQGVEVMEKTEIMEVRPAETQGYTVHFTVPPGHVNGLVRGARVRIQIYGMPGQRGLLQGEIGKMQLDTAGRLQAVVMLTPASVSKLDDPRNGIALRGPSTASVVYVRRNDLAPLATLGSEFWNGVLRPDAIAEGKQSLSANAIGWLVRLRAMLWGADEGENGRLQSDLNGEQSGTINDTVKWGLGYALMLLPSVFSVPDITESGENVIRNIALHPL